MTRVRSAGIAIIGLSGLIIVFVFVAYVQLILLCLALMICLLVLMGFLREGYKPGTFWIATARKSDVADSVPPQDCAEYRREMADRHRRSKVRTLYGRRDLVTWGICETPRAGIANLKPHPVVRRRPVSRGHRLVIQSQIHSELRAVVHQVIKEHLPVG
jgi:hypothetical protein